CPRCAARARAARATPRGGSPREPTSNEASASASVLLRRRRTLPRAARRMATARPPRAMPGPMLDARYVTDHLEDVRARLATRGPAAAASLERIAALAPERSAAITRVEALRAERNEASAAMAKLDKKSA